ncbi:MAG: TlpA family protein disulfide reductase [Synergistaceae bacterium]|jgi:thiol-disulfide isomerase/thioredoxin|nr:TlpA family protein disulfide reductase [Synergistaceae bacterium]
MEDRFRFPAFSSQTIEGAPVTDAVFAEKRLTMVNMWATWCPPCVGEMPDLAELARDMPEGSQLVGIVMDVSVGDVGTPAHAKAKAILSQAGADFMQILRSDDMTPYLSGVRSIPATIFVNSEGRVIEQPLVGARSASEYCAEVESLLDGLNPPEDSNVWVLDPRR